MVEETGEVPVGARNRGDVSGGLAGDRERLRLGGDDPIVVERAACVAAAWDLEGESA